jgi:hypothetical protein
MKIKYIDSLKVIDWLGKKAPKGKDNRIHIHGIIRI